MAFKGSSMTWAPLARISAGTAPPAGSLSTRLAGPRGISSKNRLILSQSRATRISKRSSMPFTGPGPKRTMAADSPPRIWGPAERVMRPWKPARATAARRIDPVVTAPLPPEPVMAMDSREGCPLRDSWGMSGLGG